MRARLTGAARRLQRAALPVLATRQRDRVCGVVADLSEVLIGGLRIVGKAQRDPAGGELVLGAWIVFRRRQRVARHHVGGLILFEIEQLAGNEAPLDPPLIEIVLLRGATRGCLQQPCRFDRLVLAAQPLCLVEQVSGVAACALRHGIEQRARIRGFIHHRLACAADQQIGAAEELRHAHAGVRIVVIEPAIHARLVVGARQHLAEGLHDGALHGGRAGVLAPSLACKLCGGRGVALGEQRTGKRELALRGHGL